MNRHRAVVALVVLVSACTVGRTSSGETTSEKAVVAAMEHYTALIKAVASDSIAAMYTEDGERWWLTRRPPHPKMSKCSERRPISGARSPK